MPSFYASVTCPGCGTRFQSPVDQIVDVRVDPAAKSRMLSGAINVAQCPACGTAGKLNLPFIYHDPENEVALLYLPFEVGKTEVERQKLAGTLTQQLMNSLAPEERKGYLFQPETFINMETLMNRVFELEGIDESELARSREQQLFVDELLQAEPEDWPAMLAAQDALVDESFFALLDYVLRVLVSAAGPESEEVAHARALYEHVSEQHPLGQQLKQRAEIVQRFMENPSREALVDALIAAQDEPTVNYLVQMGLQAMDYAFFQLLVKRIEAADDEEQTRLKALRRRILDLRDETMEQSEAIAQERLNFLHRLINSEDPLKMARSHLSELDELFSAVLRAELQRAAQEGAREYSEQLQRVMQVIMQLQEESLPPEIALLRQLMQPQSDEQFKKLVADNAALVRHPGFAEMLAAFEQSSREEGQDEVAEQLAQLRARLGAPAPTEEAPAQPQTQPRPDAGEEQTPSGLIIAKR